MDQMRTQAAFFWAGTGGPPVTFSWDPAGRTLTARPNTALVYQTGIALDVAPRTYSYVISSEATDRAGNALPRFSADFSTLRRISLTLKSIASSEFTLHRCIEFPTGPRYTSLADRLQSGDRNPSTCSGEWFTAYLTFDISPLPSEIASWESANMRVYQIGVTGQPYASGGRLLIWSRDGQSPTPFKSALLSQSPEIAWKQADVLMAAKDTHTNRLARENLSRHLIDWENKTAPGYASFAMTATSPDLAPRLETTFLIP